jgi:hypothetical protein
MPFFRKTTTKAPSGQDFIEKHNLRIQLLCNQHLSRVGNFHLEEWGRAANDGDLPAIINLYCSDVAFLEKEAADIFSTFQSLADEMDEVEVIAFVPFVRLRKSQHVLQIKDFQLKKLKSSLQTDEVVREREFQDALAILDPRNFAKY